jgi:ATP-dependent DNA helicase DinG
LKHNIDKKPGEGLKAETLQRITQHIFTEILPQFGYAVRENQVELAGQILAVLARRGLILAESEVGTGKTHAYLIAATAAKRGRLNDSWLRGHYPKQSWAESAYMPVVISTSSIALQNAVIKDYIPELSRILLQHDIIQTPLTAAVRKGREHYICEQRFQRHYNNAADEVKHLLYDFVGSTAPFDLTNADTLSPYIKRGICVSEKCGDNCPHRTKCRYQKHLREINDPKVDFQITNHNYFLADTLHRAGGKRPLLPNYQLVIIDEAHKFLAAARSMYGLELTSDELPELAREIHTFISNRATTGVNVHRLAKRFSEQSEKLFRKLTANAAEPDDDTERFPAIIDSEVLHYLRNIAGVATELAGAVESSRVHKLYKERQSKALWRLNIVQEKVSALRKQNKLIHWFEKSGSVEGGSSSLCAIPKDLNERLYKDLWSRGIPILLTSGTLSASGDFSRIKETLGIDRVIPFKVSDTTMPSPFNHRKNCLMYISENVPFPDNKDKHYITAVANEVERLILAAHGHAVVLFTSYNVMGRVHALLKARNLPFPLFRLERGGVNAIGRFKQSKNGILLASGALWEGIDIPGDTLSLLIIVKLPFAVPDPIGDYERSLCDSMEEYKTKAIVPDMLVKLKQGFGRLIRTETDTGVVAILDSRANNRGAYRERVLAALPECRVVSSTTEIKNFMRTRKSSAFFDIYKKGRT